MIYLWSLEKNEVGFGGSLDSWVLSNYLNARFASIPESNVYVFLLLIFAGLNKCNNLLWEYFKDSEKFYNSFWCNMIQTEI